MIRWFAHNGVAANLLMLLIVVGGLVSLVNLKRELFPPFTLDSVTITVPFPGASPEEVEETVVVRIEEALAGVDGIKEIRSVAGEGAGVVTATIQRGYSLAAVKDRIQSRVDAIPSFPAETERPVVEELVFDRDTIWISIYGAADERSLKEVANRVRTELLALPSISQVVLRGIRPDEISIEVSEVALRAWGLSIDEVARAVGEASIDLPAGQIRTSAGDIQLRLVEQAHRVADFERIVVRQTAGGERVLLSDVAQVIDGFSEDPLITRFNGYPAALIVVREVGQENPLRIADDVYAYVERARAEWLPEGLTLEAWGDSAFYLKGRLQLLINNGLIGFALVLLVLALFLRPSLAFFVAIGIPVAFLGTFALAPFIGLSINLISLFAFILVLGIVVDDAIVVGESVFSEYQQSGPGLESAIIGAERVTMPVVFAILTTVVAFVPVFFLPGLIGKFFVAIPLVVIPTLLFSLVQTKLVLPYHLSLCRVGDRQHRDELNILSRWQRRFTDGLENFVRKRYQPFLEKVLPLRYLALSLFLVVLIFTLSMVGAGWVRFVQFPNVPSDFILVELEMVPGTGIEQTIDAVEKIENGLIEVVAEIEQQSGFSPLKHRGVVAGVNIVARDPTLGEPALAANVASIIVELSKSEIRDSSAFDLSNLWRERVGEVAGATTLTFNASASGPVGLPIDIRLAGADFDNLRAAAAAVRERLREFDGLFDIRDSYTEGKREIQVRRREHAEALGVSSASLARQLRQSFYGAEVQRIQRGREDVKVMVRYPAAERRSPGNLDAMRVRLADGREIPFEEVAEFSLGYGFSSITRFEGMRVINVQADADKSVANTTEINRLLYREILPEILLDFPGVTAVKDGEARDFEELLPNLISGMVFILFVIYALLAVPFRSYLQPLIVMFVIPFGISGAILGHFVTGQDLSLLSLLGIIALTGVVVNDSLVLVDYINRRRREGMPVWQAVCTGGQARFRPILLTSLTTFAGLVPILLERSLQAKFLVPMATSLSFGVLFATFITLILVPCCYLILEDLKNLRKKLFA